MVADMMADMEVDMVADMELDKVAKFATNANDVTISTKFHFVGQISYLGLNFKFLSNFTIFKKYHNALIR